jgi:hypothetical protein
MFFAFDPILPIPATGESSKNAAGMVSGFALKFLVQFPIP